MTHRRDSHPTVIGVIVLALAAALAIQLLFVMILLSRPAKAEDDRAEIRRQLISSCRYWENCGQYFKQRSYVPRHYELHRFRTPEVRVYGYREDRYSPECRDFVTTVGEERYGRDRAKEAAEQAWMEEVRNKYGVRHMDLRNSHGGTWECGRSSTGNRASEKSAETIGKFLEQCTLRARPCRAELERVNRE